MATYGNPGFVSPPPMAPRQGNGLAVAGMVCGIIGVVICWIPFFGWALALLGLIFGALGVSKSKKTGVGGGMAMSGVILGIIGLLMGVALFFLIMRGVSEIRKGVREAASELDKMEQARMTVSKYAFEAYPEWATQHPDKKCPDRLDELDEYLDGKGKLDPWGHPYEMKCIDKGIEVISRGPDGEIDTPDDIRSSF
ncbi:MAG TPA: type II secretion system protein GspG [Kofleriaceae bacterium]|nr:type II secretion system protein GspG [Kofleriaceae bacterium]